MKTYLEYQDEKSHKFWEIQVNDNSHIVRYGKIGSDGRTSTKTFDSEEKAKTDAERLIKSKIKKGYTEITAGDSEKQVSKQQPADKKAKPDNYKVNLDRFENKLRDWGFGYPVWSGCRLIQDEDVKVKKRMVDPEQDCIMYDERCHEGTYGISHEVHWEILDIKLKNAKKFGVDYKLKPIKKAVSTYELMCRYMWMSDLFTHWEFKRDVAPLTYNENWEDIEDINKSFDDEINALENDPHLALYWLLHTGFTCDNKRFQQVKDKINEFNLAEQLTDIYDALAWFEKHDEFYNMPLKDTGLYNSHEPDADYLFLIRRAYLMLVIYTYKNRGGENAFEQWWLSVKLYPKAEEYMIRRMRWLWRNLDQYNQWHLLEEKLKTDNTKIALLSYVLAQNPNETNKSKFADQFIKELEKGKNLWKDDTAKAFAQQMIFDLKDAYTDTQTLKRVMQFYFSGKMKDERFVAIQNQHFKDENITVIVTKDIKKLTNILQHIEILYVEDEESLNKCLNNWNSAKDYLKKLKDKKIKAIVEEVITDKRKHETLCYALIEFLFENPVKDKEDLLLMLFDGYMYMPDFMFKRFLKTLIKDDEDPNLSVIAGLYSKTYGEYSDMLPYAFTGVLHLKGIFERFIGVFSHVNEKDDKATRFLSIMLKADRKEVNHRGNEVWVYPLERLNKQQINRLYDTTIQTLYRLADEKKGGVYQIMEVIAETGKNPLAKDWVEHFLQNFETFEKNYNPPQEACCDMDSIKANFRRACSYLKITDKELLKKIQ